MKIILSIFAMLALLCNLSAKTWTLDNRPGANFITLAAAHSAAASGDTILVSGSGDLYDGTTLTKQLVIIGPGYFLDENTGLQANPYAARISGCSFNAGSANTVVMGIHFTDRIYVRDKLTIHRCLFYGNNGGLHLQTGADSTIISQSFIVNTNGSSGNSAVHIEASLADVQIHNNYIEHAGTYYPALRTYNALTGNSAVYNNLFRLHVTLIGGSFYNNILIEGSFDGTGVTPINCICNGTQFEAANDNQRNVDMNSVFVFIGSTDGQYQLLENGPAAGAGVGGVDCGMFDNSTGTGYILSGIPPVPAVYDFSADAEMSNVNVKIRSNP